MSTESPVPADLENLILPHQAASMLGISKVTLWRWVGAGKISATKLAHQYFHINEVNRVKEEMAQK